MRRQATVWAAPRGRMHRAFRGLYANRMIQFGNKVSFAENKSRRTWKPNVQRKTYYSETLGQLLKFRITTRAIKNVRKAGGIDEYLIKTTDSEIKYPKALEYKHAIIALRQQRLTSSSESPYPADQSTVLTASPLPATCTSQGLRDLVKPLA